MKTLMLAAALASGLGLAPGPARADDDGKKVLQLLRGRGAHAEFATTKGCVTTLVHVQMDDDRTQAADGVKDHLKIATLAVEQFYDTAAGPQCARLDPTIQDSDVEIVNPKMEVSSDLKSARLRGEARLFDAHAGVFRSMKFDLCWKGKGKVKRTFTRTQKVEGAKLVIVEDEVEQRSAE